MGAEFISIFLICVLAVAVLWVFLKIPIWIGESRGISSQNLQTVRLLSILSLLFGVTWVVALVLACVYPPDAVPAGYRGTRGNIRSVSSVSLDMPDTNTQEQEVVVTEGMEALRDEPAPKTTPPAAQTPAPETCENCGRSIGRLETASIWKDHVVCPHCYKNLNGV